MSLQRSHPRRLSGPSERPGHQRRLSGPSERPGVITTISSQTTFRSRRAPRCRYNDLVPNDFPVPASAQVSLQRPSLAPAALGGSSGLPIKHPLVANNPRDIARKNQSSIRVKQLRRLEAVAAFPLSIARAKNPCDKVRKNIHSLRAKLRAELNLGYKLMTGRLLSTDSLIVK